MESILNLFFMMGMSYYSVIVPLMATAISSGSVMTWIVLGVVLVSKYDIRIMVSVGIVDQN